MNIKLLLIERERMAYIQNRTEEATFLDNVLEHVISLEEMINERDSTIESLKCKVVDSKLE